MDYIFGRTDKPQGKLYDYNPKIKADSEQMRQFIEMCFDPNSAVSERLKNTLIDTFVSKIYLSDDKLTILYNVQDDQQIYVPLGELKSSPKGRLASLDKIDACGFPDYYLDP